MTGLDEVAGPLSTHSQAPELQAVLTNPYHSADHAFGVQGASNSISVVCTPER